ncbi:MAG: 16S rRNA (cytosine(967)-C(5))-methyltransferase RsmB [Methylococcales bacterium]|nr:16S rRNA (cytosine(967)-C(5))-methyltransferase RsmB [Methylococcales bacterium]
MNTRLIAARVLARVLQDGQSLTTALDSPAFIYDSPKDKAFVQAISFGVCRQYHRLDFILSQLLDKPLKDSEVKALVLVGLYQLSFMRVKPHAAVSETVSALAKKKSWAKGLLNALLRRYLREQDTLEAQANQDAVAAVSHPDWLMQRIEHDWADHAAHILHENNQQPPMVLRLNLARTERDSYLQRLADLGITGTAVAFCPSAIVLEKPVAVDLLPDFADGWVSVQDTAAQLAAGLLDVQAGQRVLDLCAAPGGKTAHIFEAQPQLKELVAVDVEASRMQRVTDNCQRLKLSPTLIVGDAADPASWWNGELFERILVDAPCSALGVIRRHPDIKLLRRPEDIAVLQCLQRDILNAAWSMLAAGGVLLYATCSVLKQENEQQIDDFLAAHPDAAELPIHADWGIATTHGRQVLTGMESMDGFYYARLVKNAVH